MTQQTVILDGVTLIVHKVDFRYSINLGANTMGDVIEAVLTYSIPTLETNHPDAESIGLIDTWNKTAHLQGEDYFIADIAVGTDDTIALDLVRADSLDWTPVGEIEDIPENPHDISGNYEGYEPCPHCGQGWVETPVTEGCGGTIRGRTVKSFTIRTEGHDVTVTGVGDVVSASEIARWLGPEIAEMAEPGATYVLEVESDGEVESYFHVTVEEASGPFTSKGEE